MKTSSKVFFVLGALSAIGAMSLVYCAIKDTDKSPQELLDDGKKLIKKSAKKATKVIDETADLIEKETKSIMKEASKII